MSGFFLDVVKKNSSKKTQASQKTQAKKPKNSRKSLKTELFANSEAPIELKLFKIQKIWHFSSKFPTILAVFSQTLGKNQKNSNKTHRIYEKTQGNLAKTQLSANSELVRNAEFCPKKSLDIFTAPLRFSECQNCCHLTVRFLKKVLLTF